MRLRGRILGALPSRYAAPQPLRFLPLETCGVFFFSPSFGGHEILKASPPGKSRAGVCAPGLGQVRGRASLLLAQEVAGSQVSAPLGTSGWSQSFGPAGHKPWCFCSSFSPGARGAMSPGLHGSPRHGTVLATLISVALVASRLGS